MAGPKTTLVAYEIFEKNGQNKKGAATWVKTGECKPDDAVVGNGKKYRPRYSRNNSKR